MEEVNGLCNEYDEFFEMGKEFHVPVLDPWLEIEVIKNGIVVDHYKDRSHSWNRNAYNWMMSQLGSVDINGGAVFDAGYINIKNTAGSVQNLSTGVALQYPTTDSYGYKGAAADITVGIVVGSGLGAESFNGYVLGSPIPHGASANTLAYNQSNTPTLAWASGTLTWASSIVRYLNNNSGGTVTVNEVGLYMGGGYSWRNVFGSQFTKYITMVNRDNISASPISCDDASQLRLTYSVSLVYPSPSG